MIRDQRKSKSILSKDFLPDAIANEALVDPTLGGKNYIFRPPNSMQFRLVDANRPSRPAPMPGSTDAPLQARQLT